MEQRQCEKYRTTICARVADRSCAHTNTPKLLPASQFSCNYLLYFKIHGDHWYEVLGLFQGKRMAVYPTLIAI